ncbi:MAG: hypothetical protein COA98_07935 [Candidatus Neomarinimicrobiota bacterium]|jgi:hypothetical protein|uniref:hypothetical protein n=1 Tax=unclassified Marinobacter TaxID=83889 RepID=UPI000BC4F326|nr:MULTISPECIES: hypothetical protein [unclassified Marinobacter]MAB53419.1 hypothetical protein [Marinobacter sp.]PCJ11246.1 MAG: hypothetical protein COA98_07935 [Candidatus Neomarinimicrobiota bacterium]|tara:strand:- start:6 stop:1649 length:1644 start_codon:yes stop_codon:yes gene_type:complete
MHRKILPVVILIGFCQAAIADGLARDEIIHDFEARQGVVIPGPDSNTRSTYIDLGTSQGVSVGDLFSVTDPGQTVTHPATGEEMTLESEASALLGITRANENHSIARVIKGAPPKTGEKVRRFWGLDAYFIDPQDQGRELYSELRSQLPHIYWLGYSSGDEASAPDGFSGLVFRYTDSRLNVDHVPDWPIASYKIQGSQNGFDPQPLVQADMGQGLPPLPYPERRALLETQPISSDLIVNGPELLIAAGTEDRITVSSYQAEAIQQIVSFPIPHRNRLLSVRWWQPEGSSRLFLALTTWDGEKVEGMLLRLDGDQVTEFRTNLPFMLGAFDLDGNRTAETLIGQPFNRNDFYGQPLREFSISADNALQQNTPSLSLPASFRVIGSLLTDLTGDGKFESISISDSALVVRNSSDNVIHRSERNVGTELSSLSYELNPSQAFSPVAHVNIEPSPVLLNGPENQKRFLIFPRNGRSDTPISSVASTSTTNRLGSLVFDGTRFIESTVPYRLEGRIAAMAQEDGKLWILLSAANSDTGRGAELLSLTPKTL